ncbi:MAG: transcriptional repressor [Oscillospiraceae bacterium]|nr:transcriptional repressor [Oscillospiraceae bacterium]
MEINRILSGVGLKCTRQRIQVMEILLKNSAPMTAENIYELTDDMSLSTVYRIAEKLFEKGIVSKHTIQDSDKFYYEISADKHRHYAICLECGRMRHISVCPVTSPAIDGFTVTGHKLEIYGYCDKCSDIIADKA